MKAHHRSWPNWRRRIRHASTIVVIALLVLLIWGVAIEPRLILDHRAFDVTLPRLPRAADGMRVAVIADFQVGMCLANRAMVRRTVEEVVKMRPDVVLIAGDFIYDYSDDDGDGVEERSDELREREQAIREAPRDDDLVRRA